VISVTSLWDEVHGTDPTGAASNNKLCTAHGTLSDARAETFMVKVGIMPETVTDFLASHPYSKATIRTYQNILDRLLAETNPEGMKAIDLVKFVDKAEWGNSRQCVALACCQKFIAWRYGHEHPALRARIKRVTGKPQRALDAETILILLASFNTYKATGARDLALCALAIDTGLRASELCRLLIANTDIEHRTLQVVIKGGQWSAAIFGEHTAEYIKRWLNYRKTVTGPGHLFTNTFTGQGLTPEGLNSIVRQWGKRIGIKLNPHMFRRSMATLATIFGAPERVLMEGGRWQHSEMITRYTRTLKLGAMRKYLPVDRIVNEKEE
jgi:site-specific recombinase XerD